MKLYHYSKERYSDLRTLAQQREISEKERKDGHEKMVAGDRVGMYFDHISFFLEPVSLDIIGTIFDGANDFWKSDTNIFRYIVESKEIRNFSYEIVETPEKTALFYDDSIDVKEYHKRLKAVNELKGYVGHSNAEFEKAAKPLLGTTNQLYKQLRNRPNWDDIKTKYAATVPHVMIYPKGGIVKYESCISVRIK